MPEPWIEVPDGSPFPLANLPLGVGRRTAGTTGVFTRIGDTAIDLARLQTDGWLDGLGFAPHSFERGTLNGFLAHGRDAWRALRQRLGELLTDSAAGPRLQGALVPCSGLTMSLPVEVGDYTDFYSSLHHATNLGRLFRPDGEALLPNWRHLPVGYHGRSGTIVADGAEIPRPWGLRSTAAGPEYGPSERLDLELELGWVVGVGSERGHPIAIEHVSEHLAGVCLVNDWSARDIQAFEYQPLGPFLGKSFATSMSPWLVSLDALEPFRRPAPVPDPPVAAYLSSDQPWAFELELEVLLQTARMRDEGEPPALISAAGFADMYWTPAQQLAHLTVNGASTRPGDLLASGTVSGPRRGTEGSLMELTQGGTEPVVLPDGSERRFLEDGDRVVLRGWAGAGGDRRLGLGEVSGTVVPARRCG